MTITTKAIELIKTETGKLVEVRVKGKLEKEDYQIFVPEVERLIEEHGKINMLVHLENFHGWTAGALWEDIKFDLKHFRDMERLAIIGDAKWEKGMALFCRPFTTAKVRFFTPDRMDEAHRWLTEEEV